MYTYFIAECGDFGFVIVSGVAARLLKLFSYWRE